MSTAVCAWETSNPREVSGGWTPKPRKDSAVSVRMPVATRIVAFTMIGPSAFGSRCRKMIRVSEAPSARAASMNSFSRSDRTAERTTRATYAQVSPAITMAIQYQEPPVREEMTSAIANSGSVSTRSAMRIMTASTMPR